MNSTSQLVVYDALVAALQSAPVLADGQIKTMRDSKRPMPEGVTRQLRVFLDRSRPDALLGGNAPVDWMTQIRVECLARDLLGPNPVSAFDAATLLAASVQQRVLESATLAALVTEVQPAPMQWAEDEADTTLGACQCLFTLTHRAPFSNLIV